MTDAQQEELEYQIVRGLWAYSNQHDDPHLSRERYAEIRKLGDYSPYNGQATCIAGTLTTSKLIALPSKSMVKPRPRQRYL